MTGPITERSFWCRAKARTSLRDAAKRIGLRPGERSAPWAASFAPSYARKPAAWPNVTFALDCAPSASDGECADVVVTVASEGTVGPVELTLVDHDGETVTRRTQAITPGERAIRFRSAHAVSRWPRRSARSS